MKIRSAFNLLKASHDNPGKVLSLRRILLRAVFHRASGCGYVSEFSRLHSAVYFWCDRILVCDGGHVARLDCPVVRAALVLNIHSSWPECVCLRREFLVQKLQPKAKETMRCVAKVDENRSRLNLHSIFLFLALVAFCSTTFQPSR